MNLYDILGVAKIVSKEELKKAYRKKASELHPDKGGDESQFRALATAYSILFDEEKRKRYDSGEDADSISKAAVSEEQQIIANLVVLFIKATMENNPKYSDIRHLMIKHINAKTVEIDQMIAKEKQIIERIETALLRLKISDGENCIAVGARSEIANHQNVINKTEQEKKIGKGMIAKLEAFSYEFEQDPSALFRQQKFGFQLQWDPVQSQQNDDEEDE